jgi:hypothetical protein
MFILFLGPYTVWMWVELEVHTASIFRVKVSSGYSAHEHTAYSNRTTEVRTNASSRPMVTVYREKIGHKMALSRATEFTKIPSATGVPKQSLTHPSAHQA